MPKLWRGKKSNQYSPTVIALRALEDTTARLCDMHDAITDLRIRIRQAHVYAHAYLPDDWHAGALANLDELSHAIEKQRVVMRAIPCTLTEEDA